MCGEIFRHSLQSGRVLKSVVPGGLVLASKPGLLLDSAPAHIAVLRPWRENSVLAFVHPSRRTTVHRTATAALFVFYIRCNGSRPVSGPALFVIHERGLQYQPSIERQPVSTPWRRSPCESTCRRPAKTPPALPAIAVLALVAVGPFREKCAGRRVRRTTVLDPR